ncbi:hypothetical protein Barb6_00349 [Bacteroidales bacterium Barb6]|nr:hypothetical protein Barb6_00349 [Bacteroidales bacterium Barb6]
MVTTLLEPLANVTPVIEASEKAPSAIPMTFAFPEVYALMSGISKAVGVARKALCSVRPAGESL